MMMTMMMFLLPNDIREMMLINGKLSFELWFFFHLNVVGEIDGNHIIFIFIIIIIIIVIIFSDI